MGDLEAVPGQYRGQGRGDVVVVFYEQESHRPPSGWLWRDTASTPMDARRVKGVPALKGFPLWTRYARASGVWPWGPVHAECPFESVSLCSISAQM
ncbi:hypothetical protein GCM10010219_53970 [Streptomyces netropsis]|nr:hypothetical protein GCM10010219_53970 [Streptomyces netropsis]